MNQEFVKSVLAIWIIGLNEFLYGNEPQKALTEAQIESTCDLLTEMPEFRNITIADLSLVFKKAYAGEFGKLYGRIRPDVIIEWFVSYFEKRCNASALINQTETMQLKQTLASASRQSEKETESRDKMKKAVSINFEKKRFEELKANEG